MKKKILLVSANQLAVPYPVYPLGISYLKTYLKNNLPDHEIFTFDFLDNSYESFKMFVLDLKPVYTGISLRNIDDVNIYKKESYIRHYRNIIEELRNVSDCIIILGGAGFSIFPEILFNFLEPDFAIQGEGEESFFKLICAIENNTSPEKIEGLLFKKKGTLVINREKNCIRELDLEFEDNFLDFYWQKSGMLNIQTKRGCPYHCIYCTYPLIEGTKVRTLNADKIVESLSDFYRNKGIDYFFFTDSIFNISNEFNYRLAEGIIREKINIKWGAYFNFCNLDEKFLKVLKKAGLEHIEFGTESLSETVLKAYNKPFSLDEIFKACETCNKLGINFAHFLILGGYGETEDTIDETFRNSSKIENTVYFPFIGMRIYPGTKLHEIALEEKKIERNDDLLEPKYYISDKFEMSLLKQKAKESGKRWVFPDEDLSVTMNRMRAKNKKGPLWEYLIS